MAEYIDRERLKEVFHRNIVGNYFDQLIDMQPTTDVIERSEYDKVVKNIDFLSQLNGKNLDTIFELRSKIDKAIEELEKEIKENHLNVIEYADAEWILKDFVYGAIGRLKRNIGEQ